MGLYVATIRIKHTWVMKADTFRTSDARTEARNNADGKTFQESEYIQRQISAEARTLLGAPGLTTRSKTLLVTKGIATRSKDATSSSWPYY